MSCELALFLEVDQLLPANDGVSLSQEKRQQKDDGVLNLEHGLKLPDDIEMFIWIIS